MNGKHSSIQLETLICGCLSLHMDTMSNLLDGPGAYHNVLLPHVSAGCQFQLVANLAGLLLWY